MYFLPIPTDWGIWLNFKRSGEAESIICFKNNSGNIVINNSRFGFWPSHIVIPDALSDLKPWHPEMIHLDSFGVSFRYFARFNTGRTN